MTITQERMTVAGLSGVAVLSVGMIVFGNVSLALDADREPGSRPRGGTGVVSGPVGGADRR